MSVSDFFVKIYIDACIKGDAIRASGLSTPETITRIDNIRYNDSQLLDIYYPNDTDRPRPTIISIHGGGWVYGSKDDFQFFCMDMATRGFTVVNFDYRLAPEFTYPSQLRDCLEVFKFIEDNHQKYFIDLDNLFLLGDSAGAQMAHQLTVMHTSKQYCDIMNLGCSSLKFRALGLNCGIYSLEMVKSSLFVKAILSPYLGWRTKHYGQQLYPLQYQNENFPPVFVFTSKNDFFRYYQKPLLNRLKKNNTEHIFKVYGKNQKGFVGHVFHVDIKTAIGQKANSEQLNFFISKITASD
ncbi:MAG TPA: alpha/beta hydrolase fold domain-containing protein [Erysipelotrichaceae bacterium]|nr:alpha/beta hydrolase fold domain-containing protein [Erysipelotrichaceae bacterium]